MKNAYEIKKELEGGHMVLASIPYGVEHEAYISTLWSLYRILESESSWSEYRDSGVERAIRFVLDDGKTKDKS